MQTKGESQLILYQNTKKLQRPIGLPIRELIPGLWCILSREANVGSVNRSSDRLTDSFVRAPPEMRSRAGGECLIGKLMGEFAIEYVREVKHAHKSYEIVGDFLGSLEFELVGSAEDEHAHFAP